MKQILANIQSGDFAREWIAENRAGQQNFQRLRSEAAAATIESTGQELRLDMSWIERQSSPTSRRMVTPDFLPPPGPDSAHEPGRWEARPQDGARPGADGRCREGRRAKPVLQAGEHPPRNAQALCVAGPRDRGDHAAPSSASGAVVPRVAPRLEVIAIVLGRQGSRRAFAEGIGGEPRRPHRP